MGMLLGITGGWRITSAGLPGDASALASRLDANPTPNPSTVPESCEYAYFGLGFFLHLGFGAPQNQPANPTLLQEHVGGKHPTSGSGAGVGPGASINPPARPTANCHFGTICGLRDLLLLLPPCRGAEGPSRPNSLHSRSFHPSILPSRASTHAAGKHPSLLQALPLAIKEKPKSAV